MIEPPKPAKGAPLLEWAVRLWYYIRAIRPLAGPGLQLRETPSGTIISIAPRKPGQAAAALPLTLRAGSAPGKLQIIPGTVNALMPTLGGIALDAEEPPEITAAADVWVWLKCVGTFGIADSYGVTIETSGSAAVPAGTAITGTGFVSYLLVGAAEFGGGAAVIVQNRSGGDLGVESFGANNLWWQI